MNQEILNIISSGLSIIITGLCSWGVAVLINWLNVEIADKKLAAFLTKMTTIVTDTVQSLYQQVVETLKNEGRFNEAAQKEIKQRAINIITGQLTEEMKKYISDNFGEIEAWVGDKIESVIYNLKNK